MRASLATSVLLTLALAMPSRRAAAELTVASRWDGAAIEGIRDAKLGAPVSARALAIVDTCMYDAWAAYDEHAVGTQLHRAVRRPASENPFYSASQPAQIHPLTRTHSVP